MTTKENPSLSGRVAQIINARELVINIGTDQGVRHGMIFAVLADTPVEVRDPQTNELLDTIEREKVRVKATEIRKRITICKTYRVTRHPGGILYMPSLMTPPRDEYETLKAEDSSLPEPLSPEQSYVKINDMVILVEEDK